MYGMPRTACCTRPAFALSTIGGFSNHTQAMSLCGQHHWPVWGADRVVTMIRQQRDLYKFVHDQTVRLMNHGLNAEEIAETIRLPPSLDRAWHARGYYGHIRHNVKAIYQKSTRQRRAQSAFRKPHARRSKARGSAAA
jgi:alkyl sulfatase BDS1-like metallo-beta-lactamase superfamily hydrolase